MSKKIRTISNEHEALRIKDILEKNNIPHMIRSFHDSVYDGIFQNQLGWGTLEADEKDEQKIMALLEDILH